MMKFFFLCPLFFIGFDNDDHCIDVCCVPAEVSILETSAEQILAQGTELKRKRSFTIYLTNLLTFSLFSFFLSSGLLVSLVLIVC